MEKRNLGAKATIQKDTKSPVSEQKLAKIKEALKGINWNYDTLFEDLTGFIEGHEESTVRLKNIESDRQRLNSELTKSEQKIQFLNKKINEGQNEVNYLKKGYQQRIDELLTVKNELSQKYELLSQKKVHSNEKIKEIVDSLRKKEEEITQYKIQLEKSENQIHNLNHSFAEKLNKFKSQMSEKIDSKEKLITAKANRIISEKDQLQKYVTELMSDNNRNAHEIQNLKKGLAESNLIRENLQAQKNLLTKKTDDFERNLKITSSRLLAIENEYKSALKIGSEKDVYNEQLKRSLIEHKNTIQTLENDKTSALKKIETISASIEKNQFEIESYKNIIAELKTENEKAEALRLENGQYLTIIKNLKSEAKSFENEILNLKTQNQGLIEDLESKNSVTLRLEQENQDHVERYTEIVNDHEAHIEKLISQRTELQETLRDISLKTNSASENFQKALDEKVDTEDRLNELQSQLTIYVNTNKQLEEKISEISNEKNEIKDKFSNVKNELGGLKEKIILRAKEIDDLKKTLVLFDDTKRKLSESVEQLNVEKNQNKLLLDKIKSNIDKIDGLEQVNNKLLSERNSFEIELQETSEQLRDSRESLIKKNNDIKALESQITVLTTEELELNSTISNLQHELQLLTDVVNSSELKNTEQQDKISDLNHQINGLNSVILDNKETIMTLESKLESAFEEIEFEKNNVAESRNTITALEAKFNDISLQLNLSVDYKQEIEDQRDILNSKIEDLKFELSEREQDILQKQKMIDDVISERKVMSQRNEEIALEMSEIKVILDDVNLQLAEELKKNLNLEADIKAKSEEMESNKSNYQISKLKISELEDSVMYLKKDKEKLTLEINNKQTDVDNLINDLKKMKLNYTAEIKAKDLEIYDLKVERQNFIDSELRTQSKIKASENEIKDLVDQNTDSNLKLEELLSQIFQLKGDIEIKDSQITDSNDKIKELELQVADFGFKVVKASEKFDEVYTQKQILEQKAEENKKLYDSVKKKSIELDVSLQSLATREEQLNLYSRWVDSQKSGIQKQVLKLVSELKTTKELNPLNPYLKITEREISKIEVLMTKSNVFGPQRAQLESQYEQLVKQRDEVKELLSRTNIDVDLKAQTLMGVLKSSEFIPVPPLPPGKVAESETEITIL